MYESASVAATVTSHDRGFPVCHGSKVRDYYSNQNQNRYIKKMKIKIKNHCDHNVQITEATKCMHDNFCDTYVVYCRLLLNCV